MLTYKIRKINSNINWKTFILNDIYLSPDMSFISGITNSQEPIADNSRILVKKKDDNTYASYLVANVIPLTIRGYVNYSRKIPEQTVSRVVDYFNVEANEYSSKTISSTYVAYNDAVYYKYVYGDINGYFINNRYYPSAIGSNSKGIIMDERVPIISNVAVIDNHPFQVFSDGDGEDNYYLRYNEESTRLKKINGMDYTVEIFDDNSKYERIQKVILYKTEDEPIEVDDIKGGGYRYYITIDNQSYRIRFNDDYDRYGIFYKNRFFPVTYYHDEKPFLPSSTYDYVSGTPEAIVSATTRCMPPFDNHIVRVIEENPVYTLKDTKVTDKTTTLAKGNYLFTISIEDGQKIEGDYCVKFQHNDTETIIHCNPINKINYGRFEMSKNDECIISVYDFSNNSSITVSSLSIINVSPDFNNGYMEYVDYTVTESLETDSDGDFLIMMTPDENKYNIGDKIIAKSNTPIDATYDLEYDEDENEYLMYNGKRYDTIHHAFDTINMYNQEHRIIYTNSTYTSGYSEINGDIINFKFKTINGETIAQRTDPMFLKVKKSNTIMSDYLSQSHSGTSEYISSEYGDSVTWDSGYTVTVNDAIKIGTNYYKVFDSSRLLFSEEETLIENIRLFTNGVFSLEKGSYKINAHINTSGIDEFYYVAIGNVASSIALIKRFNETENIVNLDFKVKELRADYSISFYQSIILNPNIPVTAFTFNLYKVTTDTIESTIRKVTITEPQEHKFIVRDVLGSGTLLLYPQINNLTYNTKNEDNGCEKTVTPLNSISIVSDNWENFTFYLLNDIFGEEPVTPEMGLIRAYESNEPISSWDINKIRSNLDMYQSISYLNIQLPLTAFVVPNPLKEDLRSTIFTNEFADTNINQIVDMEKIPFRLADNNNNLIHCLSINANDYQFDLALNEYGTVPSYVKNSFLRMSFYDSPNTQTQELIGTMCLFFGGASISGNCGNDGLIYETLTSQHVYSVYSSAVKKNTSCEGLTLYAFKQNYELANDIQIYMKLEYNNANTGKKTPLFPYRNSEIILKDILNSLYFPFIMRYDKDKGYLFIPMNKQEGSSNNCCDFYELNNINTVILHCKTPIIKNESGIDF